VRLIVEREYILVQIEAPHVEVFHFEFLFYFTIVSIYKRDHVHFLALDLVVHYKELVVHQKAANRFGQKEGQLDVRLAHFGDELQVGIVGRDRR
jgi:hypothetical protein